MPTETEVLANDPEIKPLLGVNYLRKHQRVEREREISEVERKLNDPIESRFLANPGQLAQQNEQRKKVFLSQCPPEKLTTSQRDKLFRLSKASLEAFTENMPTREQLRHKVPGGTDHLRSWEAKNKPDVLRWKRAQILLNPQSDDRELCSIDKFRPAFGNANHGESALGRVFAQTPQSRENWDAIDWGAKETKEEFIKRMGEQGLKVTFTKRPLRQFGDKGKVYECNHESCEGRIFSGGWGKRNYERHVKKSHGGLEVATK